MPNVIIARLLLFVGVIVAIAAMVTLVNTYGTGRDGIVTVAVFVLPLGIISAIAGGLQISTITEGKNARHNDWH
ncbi:MAG: hypothetical protein NUV54_03105 [Candidatus Taylorbacteria bacterium]|nr:hypothetical protein [Candidatus Taylorbacteria bacterium]